MKKINHKIGLCVGLLSLTTFSSCLHTKQEMNRPTLGNLKRHYNRNQKKYIAGAYAGLLATAGLGTGVFWLKDSVPGSPEGNGSNLTTTTPYDLSPTYPSSTPEASNATEGSSTALTPTTPYELSSAYPSSTPEASNATEGSSTQSTPTSSSTSGVSTMTTEMSTTTSTKASTTQSTEASTTQSTTTTPYVPSTSEVSSTMESASGQNPSNEEEKDPYDPYGGEIEYPYDPSEVDRVSNSSHPMA
ncbi:hypothetical protein ACRRVB_03000 [Candidatus Cardinium hertigii]|uniref:hypothetical protein n=1 Tax=Candidatus Cardinium hertigii TaxID=247481 RepID=UPI003D7DEAA2